MKCHDGALVLLIAGGGDADIAIDLRPRRHMPFFFSIHFGLTCCNDWALFRRMALGRQCI